MIIEHLLGKLDDFQTEGKAVEKVLLDRDGLSRPHQKVKTPEGETFALSLPHGEHLFPGAVIYEDEECTYEDVDRISDTSFSFSGFTR